MHMLLERWMCRDKVLEFRNVVPKSLTRGVPNDSQMDVRASGNHLGHRFEQPQNVFVAVHAAHVNQEIRVLWDRITDPCAEGNSGVIDDAKNGICRFGYDI